MPVIGFRRYSAARAGAAALAFFVCTAGNGMAATGDSAQGTAQGEGALAALYPDRVTVYEQNALYGFAYSYPVAVKQMPALRAYLDDAAQASQADLAQRAADGQAGAKAGAIPFKAYRQSTMWIAVANVPGWLSLARETYSDTGGAHDVWSYQALLWDKKANRERAVESLFRSAAAMETALRPAMCDGLDSRRAARRGTRMVRNPADPASACIALKHTTIALWAAEGQAFDTITFMIAGGVAGPYAEGSYEVTLPVTPAMIAALKPEFRDGFAVGR